MSKHPNEYVEKIKESDISIPKIAKILDIPEQRIYGWTNKNANPKHEDMQKLQKYFGEVPERNSATGNNYQQKRLELKNSTQKEVPVYGGYTTLGNIEVMDDENLKHQIVAKLPAEVFPGCDYAEKAKGSSMYPLIMNQALLVGKTTYPNGITYGEVYIIKTKHGMDTTKFVHPGSEKNWIKLRAYNKSVPDQEIPCEDIVFACRVQWIINPT